MSIDDLARAAAADAHRRAEQEVVPMTMLEDLHRTRRSRTIGTVVAMAAVVVTASVVEPLAPGPRRTRSRDSRDHEPDRSSPPAGATTRAQTRASPA